MDQQTIRKYDWIGEDEQDLFVALATLGNSDEFRDFLLDLLSPSEIKDLAKRWRVARDLFDGEKPVEVVVSRRASKNTVSRVKRMIVEYGSGMCKTVYSRTKDLPPN